MTREERRAILGDDAITHIHKRVDASPEPPPNVVDALRRIFTRPAHAAGDAAPAANAA